MSIRDELNKVEEYQLLYSIFRNVCDAVDELASRKFTSANRHLEDTLTEINKFPSIPTKDDEDTRSIYRIFINKLKNNFSTIEKTKSQGGK